MNAWEAKDLEELKWYLHQVNNGRGRITGEAKRLLDAGYLTLRHTSMTCWCLSLSDKGRQILRQKRAEGAT